MRKKSFIILIIIVLAMFVVAFFIMINTFHNDTINPNYTINPKHKEYHDLLEDYLNRNDSIENEMSKLEGKCFTEEELSSLCYLQHFHDYKFRVAVKYKSLERILDVDRIHRENIHDTILNQYYKDKRAELMARDVFFELILYPDIMIDTHYTNVLCDEYFNGD